MFGPPGVKASVGWRKTGQYRAAEEILVLTCDVCERDIGYEDGRRPYEHFTVSRHPNPGAIDKQQPAMIICSKECRISVDMPQPPLLFLVYLGKREIGLTRNNAQQAVIRVARKHQPVPPLPDADALRWSAALGSLLQKLLLFALQPLALLQSDARAVIRHPVVGCRRRITMPAVRYRVEYHRCSRTTKA